MITGDTMMDFQNSLLNAINAGTNVVNNYTQKQAQLDTRNKQVKLQYDINAKLMDIKKSSNFENWQDDMNTFFEEVKNGMSDKNSPYYCKNNLQADMFTEILDQNQLGVSQKVDEMVYSAERDKAIVDYGNNLSLLSQMYTGQEYITKANEGAKNLFELGYITRDQYQQQLDGNFTRAYQDLQTKMFDDSIDEAIARGESFDSLYSKMKQNTPELIATDTDGLPKTFDKEAMDKTLKKTFQQNYNAKLSDLQQQNANALSSIVQAMRQENTAEGKVQQARRGQLAMNGMTGLKLSENDRLQYSALFELALGGGTTKGSGSGTGSSKPTDSFEALIKAAPDTALQMVADGDVGNTYDAVGTMSYTLTDEWYTKDFKENYGKDMQERQEDFNMLYKGKVSSESLTDAVIKKVLERYPTIQNYANNNFKNLITDMQKNPKQYGGAAAGDLADFLIDTAMGADKNMTDEQFTEQFKKHVNDCYVEKCKYVELDKKGNLEKKFNAKSEKDIAKAARLVQDKDYVFTYGGQERWAPGKKEALEAEGGIIDTLKSAVAGTLDIPESERSKIGYYYKPDAEHNDLTSTPVITYNNKAYEVIPNDDDKGFTLRDYRTGEVIEGKIGSGKAERTAAKQDAKSDVKTASQNVAQLKKDREDAVNKAITESTSTPKAMKAGGGIDENHWEDYKDLESRTSDLRITVRKMDNDAKKLDDKQFKDKYGIDLDVWNQDKVESRRFDLILKS